MCALIRLWRNLTDLISLNCVYWDVLATIEFEVCDRFGCCIMILVRLCLIYLCHSLVRSILTSCQSLLFVWAISTFFLAMASWLWASQMFQTVAAHNDHHFCGTWVTRCSAIRACVTKTVMGSGQRTWLEGSFGSSFTLYVPSSSPTNNGRCPP